MKVAVTGGNGFIGRHLCHLLRSTGNNVVSIQRNFMALPAPGIEVFITDLRDLSGLMEGFQGCEVVYHLAGVIPGKAKAVDYKEINVRGTENVLNAAHSCHVRRIVYLSSAEVYGSLPIIPCPEDVPLRPSTRYATSKMFAELKCKEFMEIKGMDVMILRACTVVGPGLYDGPIGFLFRQIMKNGPIFIFGKGTNRIQLLSMDDLLNALLSASWRPSPGGPVNLGSNDSTPLRSLASMLIEHAGSKSRILSIPAIPFKPIFAILGATLPDRYILQYLIRSEEEFILDISRARDFLGFEPQQSNIEALIDAFDWYKKEVFHGDQAARK